MFVLGHVFRHAAMGACLGLLASLALIVTDTANVFQMMTNGPTPQLTPFAFVAIFTSFITVGATLTGLIFEAVGQR